MDKRLLGSIGMPDLQGAAAQRGRRQFAQELICRPDRLAYAVRDGIPMMVPEDARALASR